MKKNSIKYFFILTCLFSNFIYSLDVPYLTGRVNDYANILTLDKRNRIEQILKTHEDSTTNQIVVLIITTLEDENLEEFANEVFNTWQLGQKEKDNGVLLLIAIQDRKLRIEVGYGLEGYLTDAISSSIIRNEITPSFRQEDYAGGIEKGVLSIIAAIEGSYTATEYLEEDELGTTE
ncbi:MAG: TPM domain-containing protein, partial [Ignavibacteriales bacterium]|nr:TPM domain-containing protein [Ignavibacteriales bacterium]